MRVPASPETPRVRDTPEKKNPGGKKGDISTPNGTGVIHRTRSTASAAARGRGPPTRTGAAPGGRTSTSSPGSTEGGRAAHGVRGCRGGCDRASPADPLAL